MSWRAVPLDGVPLQPGQIAQGGVVAGMPAVYLEWAAGKAPTANDIGGPRPFYVWDGSRWLYYGRRQPPFNTGQGYGIVRLGDTPALVTQDEKGHVVIWRPVDAASATTTTTS
jgi:hypothetical protein